MFQLHLENNIWGFLLFGTIHAFLLGIIYYTVEYLCINSCPDICVTEVDDEVTIENDDVVTIEDDMIFVNGKSIGNIEYNYFGPMNMDMFIDTMNDDVKKNKTDVSRVGYKKVKLPHMKNETYIMDDFTIPPEEYERLGKIGEEMENNMEQKMKQE